MARLITALILILLSFSVIADDPRYKESIDRDSNGVIIRSSKVVDEFRKIHKCPSTNKYEGQCPKWEVDHVIPLACKGRDEVFNLQWLPKEIKSAKGTLPKDRWERKVYCK